jgi:hypothetical protein
MKQPTMSIADRINKFLLNVNRHRSKHSETQSNKPMKVSPPADPFLRHSQAFTTPKKMFEPKITVKSNQVEGWLLNSRHYNSPRCKRRTMLEEEVAVVPESNPSEVLEEESYSSDQVEDEESEAEVMVATDDDRQSDAQNSPIPEMKDDVGYLPESSASHDSAFDNDFGGSPVGSCSAVASSYHENHESQQKSNKL